MEDVSQGETFFKKKFYRVTKPKLEPWRGGGDLELGVFQKRGNIILSLLLVL